ncbi:hypothetical protein KKD19_04840 [Patescibacteria group bacterium]|nr:hypothetical protein [Patescibacteria group bacterium]MBU4512536.1 hypothetical protein [Patescibacteria group bacterium]MCG2692677.1 hypothetical protein [Candidatus Parcubacteria bacterium]
MLKVKTLEKKRTLSLSREVELLRSVVIGWVGRDPEGEYNPEFVQEIFESASDEPIYSFQGKNSFLQTLENEIW